MPHTANISLVENTIYIYYNVIKWFLFAIVCHICFMVVNCCKINFCHKYSILYFEMFQISPKPWPFKAYFTALVVKRWHVIVHTYVLLSMYSCFICSRISLFYTMYTTFWKPNTFFITTKTNLIDILCLFLYMLWCKGDN